MNTEASIQDAAKIEMHFRQDRLKMHLKVKNNNENALKTIYRE